MKRIGYILLALIACTACGSNPAGERLNGTHWEGQLTMPAFELPLVLHLETTGDGSLRATIDSPAEDDFGRPVERLVWREPEIQLTITSLMASFRGTLSADHREIHGEWIRGRNLIPVTLHRSATPAGKSLGGRWEGVRRYPAAEAGVILHFLKDWLGRLKAQVDIPELEVRGAPAAVQISDGDQLTLEIGILKAHYQGVLSVAPEVIRGTWSWQQPALAMPANFSHRGASLPAHQVPLMLDDGWAVGTPEASGLATAPLDSLIYAVISGKFPGVHSVLIAKNGRLVSENYFEGFRHTTLHDLRSATPLVTALLTGIAIDQGLLPGVDTPVRPFFPEYDSLQNPDPRKSLITVRHLLTMTAGFACNDWSRTSLGNEAKMLRGEDWVKLIWDLPLSFSPGEAWSYCAGGVMVLGGALAHATGQPLPAFARRHLFEPLGIEEYRWQFTPQGRAYAGGLLMLRPRDFARIGQLIINRGRWGEQQVVSAEWVDAVVRSQAKTWGPEVPAAEWGYLCWRKKFIINGQSYNAFFAAGNGDQLLIGFPELQLLAVFTGGNYNAPLVKQPLEMMERYILPAVQR